VWLPRKFQHNHTKMLWKPVCTSAVKLNLTDYGAIHTKSGWTFRFSKSHGKFNCFTWFGSNETNETTRSEISEKYTVKTLMLRVKFLYSVDFFISRYSFTFPLSKTMCSENRVIFSENERINSKSRGNLPFFQRFFFKFVVKISGKKRRLKFARDLQEFFATISW
jgi:hypothetical protein